ncbi:MAG: glycosyltransferase [Candidatus Acidiferrales bacterium]
MKLLLVHDSYQQRAGEDSVFEAERELLTSKGHRVLEYRRDNNEIQSYSTLRKLSLFGRTVWNSESYSDLAGIIDRERPDVAHFHNTFPLISPSAYYACRAQGLPVVQTLHNYRLACPAATFYRDGAICKECVDRGLGRGVVHACYRASHAATATVALMLAFHRWRRTWTNQVDCYLTLTQFSSRQFIELGLPADKLFVKPNFLYSDPGVRKGSGESFVFVGRLSPDKGVRTLLRAWGTLQTKIPLRIVGDGPLRTELESLKAAGNLEHVSLEGWKSRADVFEAIKGARALVIPSEWYECFPMVIVEAFAAGVPVIASKLGAMAELVESGKTGLHFSPGNDSHLAATVEWALTHPEEMQAMGRLARTEYERKYTADRNHALLMEAYRRAIAQHELTGGQGAEPLVAN